MSATQNMQIAQKLLEGIGAGHAPDDIAALCASDLVLEVQGDDGALPWIGRQTGRAAMVAFIQGLRSLTEPLAFDVEDIPASDMRAVIIGSLETRIKATGHITASQFALILTVADGVIARFQMLEDSFNLSNAAR